MVGSVVSSRLSRATHRLVSYESRRDGGTRAVWCSATPLGLARTSRLQGLSSPVVLASSPPRLHLDTRHLCGDCGGSRWAAARARPASRARHCHLVVSRLLPSPTHHRLCVTSHQRSQRFLLPPFRCRRRRRRCSSLCMIHPGLYDGGLRTGRPSVTCWSRDGGGTRPRAMGASSGEGLVCIPPVEVFVLRRQLQHGRRCRVLYPACLPYWDSS